MCTFVLGVEVSDVSDFLSAEEDSNFVHEEVEEMRAEATCSVRVELANILVTGVEGLHSFGVDLLFDFVKDLVGFVFPVHEVTKI